MHKATILLVLFICFSYTAAAQNLSLDVQLGFYNNQTPQGWSPLWIDVKTDIDIDGEIVISTVDNQKIPITLPAGSQRRIPSVVYLNGDDLIVQLESNLEFSVDKRISYEILSENHNVLVVSNDYTGFEFLRQTPDQEIMVFYTGSEYLPEEWLAYRELQTIIIHQADLTNMSHNQMEALLTWLSLGNTLIWTGANGHGFLDAPVFSQLFSDLVVQKAPVELDQGTLEIWQIHQIANLNIELTLQEYPVVVSSTLGEGKALFLTFDPNNPVLYNWQQKGDFFTQLMRSDQWLRVEGIAEQHLNILSIQSGIELPAKIVVLIIAVLIAGLLLSLSLYTISHNLSPANILIPFFIVIVLSSSILYLWLKPLVKVANNVLTEIAIIQKQPLASRSLFNSYYHYINYLDKPPQVSMPRYHGSFTPLLSNDNKYMPLVKTIRSGYSLGQFADEEGSWIIGGFAGSYVHEFPVIVEHVLTDDLLKFMINNDSEYRLNYSVVLYGDRWFRLGPVAPLSEQMFVIDVDSKGVNSLQQLISHGFDHNMILLLTALNQESKDNPILISIFDKQLATNAVIETDSPVNHFIKPVLVSELNLE